MVDYKLKILTWKLGIQNAEEVIYGFTVDLKCMTVLCFLYSRIYVMIVQML